MSKNGVEWTESTEGVSLSYGNAAAATASTDAVYCQSIGVARDAVRATESFG